MENENQITNNPVADMSVGVALESIKMPVFQTPEQSDKEAVVSIKVSAVMNVAMDAWQQLNAMSQKETMTVTKVINTVSSIALKHAQQLGIADDVVETFSPKNEASL